MATAATPNSLWSVAKKYLLLVLKPKPSPGSTSISKALLIRINLFFLALFLLVYVLLLRSPPSTIPGRYYCSLLDSCQPLLAPKVINNNNNNNKRREEKNYGGASIDPKLIRMKRVKPAFVDTILLTRGTNVITGGIWNNQKKKKKKIGTINMEDEDLTEWEQQLGAEATRIEYDKVSGLFEWKHLFPEWIDEEQENEGGYLCPEIPMPPNFEEKETGYYHNLEFIMAKIPCGWNRDVFRLQVHLIAAKAAVLSSRRGAGHRRPRVVVLSRCRPMMEIFRCDDLVSREGDWWLFEPEMGRLEQKLSLPIGSCNLALPLWPEEEEEEEEARMKQQPANDDEEAYAYATVLHSSEAYVCGAITLAQSLLQSGTKRDLVLLLDSSISTPKREALVRAGWKIHPIKRIRNPKAENNSYNEYNYSKFRLWQLTQYSKLVFVDADIIVLKNLDHLFRFPEMSAAGNDGSLFNSGVMVIEPSNCTFRALMKARERVISYNGGDQGFLNEMFVYWHRLPRRVNFLKNLWSNSSGEAHLKNSLFGSDPPKLYAIHYLGLKPWQCYRDYDCNFDIQDQVVYASDVAHKRWWKVHDAMDEQLQRFCGLSPQRNNDLKWDRMSAMRMALPGAHAHWNITITDPRRLTQQHSNLHS